MRPQRLADHDDVRVTLIDRHNYHQFQPLLYQVATSQLGSERHRVPLRKLFRDHQNVDVKLAEIDRPSTPRRGPSPSTDGRRADGRRARGGQRAHGPNFFRTPGAEEHAFPLYSLDDATRLRSRILGVFEDADRDPSLVDQGALNFVVVGGGPTGVETAGALADLIRDTMTVEFRDLAVIAAHASTWSISGTCCSAPFSETRPRLRGQGPAAQGRAS